MPGMLHSMGSQRIWYDWATDLIWTDASNIGAPQYVKQMLTIIKGEIDSNTIIVGEFNTPLTTMDRSSRQKINKETQILKDILDEIDLIDIYSKHFFFYQGNIEHFSV